MKIDFQQSAERIEIIAHSIDYAHERKIVHRDLKPANILLTRSEELNVSDFGLSKRIDIDQSKTQV